MLTHQETTLSMDYSSCFVLNLSFTAVATAKGGFHHTCFSVSVSVFLSLSPLPSLSFLNFIKKTKTETTEFEENHDMTSHPGLSNLQAGNFYS